MTAMLRSNRAEIPYTDRYFAPLVCLEANAPISKLASHFRQDGYVMVRRWLDPECVQALRVAYLTLFQNWLFRVETEVGDGVSSGSNPEGLPRHGVLGHPAHSFVRSAAFLDFADHPRLLELAELLLGGPAVRLRRTPLRHFVPGGAAASRAHVDHTFLSHGSDESVTFWVPLGDCPLLAGGLVYLEDSVGIETNWLSACLPHDRPEDRRHLTHDLKALSDLTGKRWLCADFGAGDLVAHSPFIVHASVNCEIDYMRISADIRFVREGEAIDPRWSQDWSADDGF